MKLDVKDLRLLYHLSKNCRLPISQLAKKVGISQEVVKYRLNRLVKKGIIVDFIADIDESKLGYGRYLIYLAFQNVDEFKEKEIIQYLINHPFVAWTTTSTGKWSIIFDFIAENIEDVNNFIEQSKEKYRENIGEYIVAPQISFQHFNSKYYQIDKEVKQKRKKIKHKVDEKDLQILQLLSNNARLDYVTLSKKLQLSPNAIKNRIKALVDSQIITGFFIHPNKTLLGFEQYYLQLDFGNQTKEQEEQFISYIREHPNVNAYYKPLGYWSIEVAVFVKNVGELRRFILDLRNKFGGFMKVHDTMLFYEEPKSNYLPKGVFQS